VVVRAIGNDLHMDYSAVGETTHLAARMEQLATPGSIRLTAATLRLVEGLVQVNALGPVPVKGLAEPMEIFDLLGASGTRRRVQAAAARGLTRFVGRQTEMATLTDALARAGAGHGQVVALVGEAGVGKSRLVYELIHSHHIHGWLMLESASVSYGKATPYFPVIDLLKRYAHVEDHDDPRTIRAKVTGQVLTLDEALQDTIPALLSLLDALPDDSPFHQLDPPQRRQRMLTALKRVLLRESQVQPLLLVFEDLHWIDSETQALLDSLVESLPAVRLFLLVNYRPEYQHGWGGKTYYTQVRLDPLPPTSAEELLQVLLGNDRGLISLKRLLIARTEGNPFFLEESVRALVETGVLIGEPGTYHLAPVVGAAPRGHPEVGDQRGLPLPTDIHVPATVQAVLAARIDRLPPEEKRLLQTAAVIGNEIPLPLLQTIAELPEEVLHRGLAHLQAAEFLYEMRLFPEPEYIFKHALTHEVTYGSLLLERRRVLHARIVEALEALAPDRGADQVERLAHHALRGEVWDKAVTYCQQAGNRAHNRGAFHEAVTAFEQALQAFEHLREPGDTRELAFDLRRALGGTLSVLGEHGRHLALLDEAEALARLLNDRARLGWVLTGKANIRRATGDFDGAMAAGQQALDLAFELGDGALQGQAFYNLGQANYAIGNFIRAAELLRNNVEASDRESGGPTTGWLSRTQAWLARTLSELGAFTEGRRHGEKALRLATLEDQGYTPIVVHGCLGHLYLTQGDLEHATQVSDQGLALCRASGNRDWLPGIAARLGYAYTLQGYPVEGRALLEEGISVSIRTGAVQNRSRWVAWLSEVCRLEGRYDEAWQHVRQALDLARQQKARGDEAFALYQLGVVQAHAEPPDAEQAESLYQQALTLAQELGMRPLQARCHFGLGALYTKSSQREQARAELSAAIDLYRDMDMTFWLPQAGAALAQLE
jgi:tetratricopeptide (TPR) repeat protein